MNLIGGEMTGWSDPGVHGEVLGALLAQVRGRTLVAGPHHSTLLDAVPAGQLTVLVRGVPDAARLAARPGVTVLCGSLAKLAAVEAYDTVVALDGLGRLRSVEDEVDGLSWADDLALLAGVLRPGGRLLLGVANPLGLHRLVALPPTPGDDEWVAGDELRPGGWPGLPAHLRRAGLSMYAGYAAYPDPAAPTVLLGPDVLADPELGGFLEATLRTAVTPIGPVLADPRRLAADAVRHGLAAELAPGWILVAGRAPAAPDEAARPGALIGADVVRRDAAGRWVQRDGEAVPLGRTLHDLVLAAALRRDLPAVRELLTSWLGGPAAGVPADRIVVDAAGHPHPLDRPDASAVVGLRCLAADMIDRGCTYLWPGPADVGELTGLLAALTGRELDPAPVDRAGPVAFRELLIARDRLTRELAEAQARLQWYDRMLTTRDDELKRLRRVNTVLAATVPGRAAAASIGGLRAGRRAVRAVVRRLRS
ncbi:hypothetical protein ACWKSP_00090 [Micromonosporaceae bacterium Da 78-11]